MILKGGGGKAIFRPYHSGEKALKHNGPKASKCMGQKVKNKKKSPEPLLI